MSLLEVNDFRMQKKILSAREHYDFLDLKGNRLGEADGNTFGFVVIYAFLAVAVAFALLFWARTIRRRHNR